MKKTFLTSLFLMTIAAPTFTFGATKSVTIDWTMSDTTNVIGYKMYYSTNSDMSGKIPACETNDPSALTLTCPNVIIDSYPMYFTISAVKSDGEVESPTEYYNYTVSAVQNFTITTPGATPEPIAQDIYTINFQPANVPVPSGFLSDSGDAFIEEKGYGWTVPPAIRGPQDRNSTDSPDETYDTLAHATAASVWEATVTSGQYKITICMGDALYPTGLQNAQIEGKPIVTDTNLSTDLKWIEKSITASVSDGRLTLTFIGSYPNAKLCWIKIIPE